MDWIQYLQLILTFIIAAVGWYVAHFFSSERDLRNARREQKTKYLIEAYDKLAGSANRSPEECHLYWDGMERAIHHIQLFGSEHQVDLAKKFAKELSTDQSASTIELIRDLRDSLRDELGLKPLVDSFVFLRFNKKN